MTNATSGSQENGDAEKAPLLTEETIQRRREAQQQEEEWLKKSGKLTADEIRQLITFNYVKGPATVEEQLQQYFLRLKDQNVEAANRMHAEIQPIIDRGIKSMEDVKIACKTLAKYWSGFVLYFNGEGYSKDFFPSNITVQPAQGTSKKSPTLNFGGGQSFESAMNEVRGEGILAARMPQDPYLFELSCEEGESFLGAVVAGRTVTWLQHGRVFSYGEEIGTYNDLGIKNGKRQMMISVMDNIKPEPSAQNVGFLQGRNVRDVIEKAKSMSRQYNKPVCFTYEGVLMTATQVSSAYELQCFFEQQKGLDN